MKEVRAVVALDPTSVYDEIRSRKVFIRPGMDSWEEFIEGVPKGKRLQLVTKNPFAMTLDEWADNYHITVSELIQRLAEATLVKERSREEEEEMEKYRSVVDPDYEVDAEIDPQPVQDSVKPIERKPEEGAPEKKGMKDRPKPAKSVKEKPKTSVPRCPKCGAPMKLRHGRYGDFWGCSRYPQCSGKLSIARAKQQGYEPPEKGPAQEQPPRKEPPRREPPRQGPPPRRETAGGEEPEGLYHWMVILGVTLLSVFVYTLGKLMGPGLGQVLRIVAFIIPVIALVKISVRSGVLRISIFPNRKRTPKERSATAAWILRKLKSWRVWITIGSIMLSLMGLVGFAEFMYEEAGQQAGFAVFVLKSGGLAEDCFAEAQKTEHLLDTMSRFVNTFGWLSPFNWQAYRLWVKGARMNAEAAKVWAISKNPRLAESVPSAEVIKVIDGDSLVLGTGEEIRLAGINAPEWYEPGGRAAEKMLKSMVYHKMVDIKRIKQGYYGRVIADISVNGQDVATALVKAGLASPLNADKVAQVDGAEGVVTKIEAVRGLKNGFALMVGEPINVFVLDKVAAKIDLDQYKGKLVEVIGKLKLYNGEPEVILDAPQNIKVREVQQ